ncbi:hypothetical protein [Tsukamurella sp. 1534]|uniref:hypothetical protein n=1 Tax=Tsukamurella sp. 1534 TaxID=1151061 RepID=UPI0002FFA278|nr:hypothetical protein [Tsukamurella sp. 1534]
MKLKKILDYREHWGDRVAWKIGNVVGDDFGPGGVIDAGITVSDAGIFTEYVGTTRSSSERRWLSLSVGLTVWRWGAWIAVRTTEVRHGE